jgi:hypothetical protein
MRSLRHFLRYEVRIYVTNSIKDFNYVELVDVVTSGKFKFEDIKEIAETQLEDISKFITDINTVINSLDGDSNFKQLAEKMFKVLPDINYKRDFVFDLLTLRNSFYSTYVWMITEKGTHLYPVKTALEMASIIGKVVAVYIISRGEIYESDIFSVSNINRKRRFRVI